MLVAYDPNPLQPITGPLAVSVYVHRSNSPVAAVRLHYRRMYAAEVTLAMTDDGTGGDLLAGDGLYTATLPASAFAPGEMTRWRFTATDTQGTETKEPPYRSLVDSHQYFGTVAHDARIQSLLPVLHWFTANPNGAGTETGSRGALYYDGEFYDNVLFNLHGQSSASFPKKSHNIDFNRTQRFRWSRTAPRVADIDLLSNWADKAKVRHVLAYEIMRASGVAAHFAFTVRVQQNGQFFSTADFVEDADETYLERAGLNPDGALYKVYANLLNRDAGNTATSGVEKKTRRTENNNDLRDLINGLDLTGTALANYLYDNIDIPACVTMLAANSVIRNIDMHSKNWYIYRDTGRSGEWSILPWDLDLSHGRVWNEANTYFDNALYTDGFVVTGTSIRLVSHLFANPAIRAMLMRRIRTLTDRFLQPLPAAGTPESALFYERRLNEQSALIDPPSIIPSDAQRDFEKWGSWLQGGSVVRYTNSNAAVESMAEAITRFKNQYLPARRRYIYNTQIVGRGGEIPLPQTGGDASFQFTPLLAAGAPVHVLVPAHGNLALTWTGLPANEPFNTAAWRSGTTGVGYERTSGYQSLIGTDVGAAMQNNNSVYLRLAFDLADQAAVQSIERLELRLKYDDGFVAYLNGTVVTSLYAPATLQWNSAATASHEANPNAFNTFDITTRTNLLRPGRNILAIHGLNDTLSSSDMIIVPELHAGRLVAASTLEPRLQIRDILASPPSGNQDEEYIQLHNTNTIAVDLSDWRIEGAIRHTLHPGTVLPPNTSLYLTPNPAAFRARAQSPKGGEGRFIQGPYQGHLSSFGEPLYLLEPAGATNTTATYLAQPTDAQRYLVISEIMYEPAVDGLAEYIELLNISTNLTLNLTGLRFTEGIQFDFTGSALTNLAPGARVLVVRDLPAFTAAYGPGLPVAGTFAADTALANGGERLKLEDATNDTIREFVYNDVPPWPAAAGTGSSLVLLAPETNPSHALPANWRASTRPGGTPGLPEPAPGFTGDPHADTDQNGQSDLLDYAFGLPSIPPRIEILPALPGSLPILHLHYTVSPAALDLRLGFDYTTDLATWHDATAHLTLLSTLPLPGGRLLLTWQIPPSLRTHPLLLLRLRVALP